MNFLNHILFKNHSKSTSIWSTTFIKNNMTQYTGLQKLIMVLVKIFESVFNKMSRMKHFVFKCKKKWDQILIPLIFFYTYIISINKDKILFFQWNNSRVQNMRLSIRVQPLSRMKRFVTYETHYWKKGFFIVYLPKFNSFMNNYFKKRKYFITRVHLLPPFSKFSSTTSGR